MEIILDDLAKFSELNNSKQSTDSSKIDFYNLATSSSDNQGLSEFESDLKNLDYFDLVNKYGEIPVHSAIKSQLENNAQYMYDTLQGRDTGDIIGDAAVGIGQGLVGSIGGLASWGASLSPFIGDSLGTAITQGTNAITQGLQELKSNELQRMQRAYNARGAMLDRESDALYEKDLREGSSSLVANLRKIGRDAINSGKNLSSSSAIAGDITAQALGSLAVGGPIAKGVRGLAKASQLARAKLAGSLDDVARAQIAKNTAQMNAWLPTTMMLEGGGGYTSGVQDVMDMPLETLMQNPDFVARTQELINQGVPENKAIEQARIELADSVGKATAGIAATTAAGLSKFSKWAEAPLAPKSFTGRLGNITSETIEEPAQGAGTQLGQNLAVQLLADANRSLSKDVGKNITESAVGGALSSGSIQGPGIIANSIGKTINKVTSDKATSANTTTANVSQDLEGLNTEVDTIISSMDTSANTTEEPKVSDLNAEETITESGIDKPESKTKFEEDKELFKKSIFISDKDVNTLSERSKEAILNNNSNNSRFRAITNLVDLKNSAKTQLEKDTYTIDIFNLSKAFIEYSRNFENSDYIDSIPEGSEEANLLINTHNKIEKLLSEPAFQKELSEATDRINALNKQTLSKTSINTPEGTQIIRATLAKVSQNPTEVNEENIKFLIDNPSLISDEAKKSLVTALNLINYKKKQAQSKSKLSEQERVTFEISAKHKKGKDSDIGKDSALDHLNKLIFAINSKNKNAIEAVSKNFGYFLEHMKNKVEATKKSITSGGSEVTFTAYSAKEKTPYTSKISVKSYRLAQAIMDDYTGLKVVVDGIKKAYPDVKLPNLPEISVFFKSEEEFRETRKKAIEKQNKEFNSGSAKKTSTKKQNSSENTFIQDSNSEDTSDELIIIEGSSNKKSSEKISIKDRLNKLISKLIPNKDNLVELPEDSLEYIEDLGLSKYLIKNNNKYLIHKDILRDPIEENTSLVIENSSNSSNKFNTKVEFTFNSGIKSEGFLTENNELIYKGKTYKIESLEKFKESIKGIKEIKKLSKESYKDSLVPNSKENFENAFNTVDSINTNIKESKKPSLEILSIIKNDSNYSDEYKSSMEELIGDDPKSFGSIIKNTLNKVIKEYLNSKLKVGDTSKTVIQNLLDKGEILSTQQGKILNLVSQMPDGSYELNEHLLDLAVLATVDWLLTRGNTYTKHDWDDALNALNLSRKNLNSEDKFNFDKSIPGTVLTQNLTNSIRNFWGISSKKDIPLGLSEGIIGALASNIMVTLAEQPNLIEVVSVPFKSNPKAKISRINQYSINISENKFFNKDALKENKGIIQQLVFKEPEVRSFYAGDKMPKAPKYQLHSRTPLTRAEQQLIEKANNIEYSPNPLTMMFVKALGRKGYKQLLGVDTEGLSLNKNHKAILDSRALVLDGGFDMFETSLSEMLLRAKATNKNIMDINKKFAFDIASQGRLQERYPNGPVSNKLSRILFRATKTTVDLSDTSSKIYKLYETAIAQALGAKIGRKSLEENSQIAKELLTKLDPSIQILKTWYLANKDKSITSDNLNALSSNDIQAIRNNFTEAGLINDLTSESIHVLLDYARLNSTSLEERKNYTTALSIEADGIAHGTIATLMFAEGIPDEKWFDNVLKGGVSIGYALSVKDSFKKAGNQDIYAAEGENTAIKVLDTFKEADINVKKMAHSLLKAMGTMFGTEIDTDPLFENSDEKGFTLNIPRDITKKFGTVKIYGSGIQGLSDNAVGPFIEQFYNKISKAIQLKEANPNKPIAECFFPNLTEEDANKAFNSLKINLKNITKFKLVKDYKKDSLDFINTEKNTDKKFIATNIDTLGDSIESLKEFEFTSKQLDTLETNIRMILGNQANSAIESTLGNVFTTTKSIVDSTSIMSSIYSVMYKHILNKYLEEKLSSTYGKNNLKYQKHYGITPEELDKIKIYLKSWNPYIDIESHLIEIPKFIRESSGIKQAVPLGGKDAFIYVSENTIPINTGVSCVPKLVQALGDAKMIGTYARLGKEESKANLVYDGIETSIDNAEKSSNTANKAMADAYKANILSPVVTAFESFIDHFSKNRKDLEEALNNEDARLALIESIYRYSLKKEEIQDLMKLSSKDLVDSIFNTIAETFNNAKLAELGIQARLNVQEKNHITVDNMSSLNQGYSNNISETNLSPEEFKAKFISDTSLEFNKLVTNTKFMEVKQKTNEGDSSSRVNTETAFPNASGTSVKSVKLTKKYLENAIKVYLDKSLISKDQAAILRPMLSKIDLLDLSLHIGSIEELTKLSVQNGDPLPSNNGTLTGWYSIGSRNIYIPSGIDKKISIESLLHEIIHATTVQSIFEYYVNGLGDSHTVGAIQNIELMMNQLVNDYINNPKYIGSPYINDLINQLGLVESIEGKWIIPETSSPEDKARRMSEFVAYMLSNPNIIEDTKKLKAPQSLLDKFKLIYEKIKELIFGISAPKLNNYYMHMKFNAYIIMKTATIRSNLTNKALASIKSIDPTEEELLNLSNRYFATTKQALDSVTSAEKFYKTYKAQSNNAFIIAEQARAAGFKLNTSQLNTFVQVFNGLQLANQLNTPALIKAQEYYSYIVENLDPNKFGRKKYDFISGKFRKNNTLGLPQFIALASVSPELREAISRISTKDLSKKSSATNIIDRTVDNIGFELLDALDNYLLDNKPTGDMLSSLDNVIDNINKLDEVNILVERENNVLDAINDSLSNKLQGKSTELGLDDYNLDPKDKEFYSSLEDKIETNTNKIAIAKKEFISKLNTYDISPTINQLVRDLIGTDAKGKRLEAIIKRAKATVQQIRQRYREIIPSTIKKLFSNDVTKQDYELMFRVFAKTDITAIAERNFNKVKDLLSDYRVVEGEIRKYTNIINAKAKNNTSTILRKSEELAEFMVNGKVSTNLLRNAYAIANLYGESRKGFYTIDADLIVAINKLVSALALKKISSEDRARINELINSNRTGMEAVIATLRRAQDKENSENTQNLTKINGYKGYVPSELESAQTLRVVIKGSKESKNLSDLGYTLIDQNDAFEYYFLDVNTSGTFSRGGFQNVTSSVYGVDPLTGRSVVPGIARITDPNLINKFKNSSSVIRIYDSERKIIALESVLTDNVNNLLKRNSDLPEMLGAQLGRQIEEIKANAFNKLLLENLHMMYLNDPNKSNYVNIYDVKDPVIRNSLMVLSEEIKRTSVEVFGKEKFLPVRKDLVEEVMGIREASVGDFWTDNTRWSPKVQQVVIQVFDTLLGKGSYTKILKAEAAIQKGAAYARNWIVVKNPFVVLGNITSNVIQLLSNGIPLNKIVPLTTKYVKELEQFTKAENEIAELEVQYSIAKTSAQRSSIRAKIDSKKAIQNKLDIKPLIDAGEFSSIADIGVKPEDIEFSFGKLGDYIEAQVDKLPDGIKIAGKYALITKDTSLYQGLNKAVQYGDLVAKAILYEHLTKQKKYSKERALDIVRDEFVNYDLQTGRTRGYLENMGLLWFYNYKLRAVKAALGLIQRNPLYGLIGMTLPMLPLLDGVGTVFTDNILTKLMDNGLNASIGPGMFSNIPFLSPVSAILH